jgi:Signal transduction histidine kinase
MLIRRAIQEDIDRQLAGIIRIAADELRKGKAVSFPPFVEVTPSMYGDSEVKTADVNIMLKGWDEPEEYRQMTSYLKINGKFYRIDARISMMEKTEMMEDLALMAFLAVFATFLALFIVSRFGSGRMFKDFFKTIGKLEAFSLQRGAPIVYEHSKISEFDELNKSVAFLSEKTVTEYKNLREFNSEVNHEMQTPLAVIRSKVELLLQNEELNAETIEKYQIILENLNKTNRINRSILLLNKLENSELFETGSCSVKAALETVLANNREKAQFEGITISVDIQNDFEAETNENLLDILLQNIISNAIKHNRQGGEVSVVLKGRELLVSNTSREIEGDTNRFFESFVHEGSSSDSVGLGLTIVRKICDLY